ncbi:ATP-dependent helicase HrpB [soil metagenome]
MAHTGPVTVPAPPPSTGLPVEDVVDEVRSALAGPGHGVLVAPPGAGKTTVVPIRLLAEPWLGDGRIVVLEPRRLAARAAARRMAELVGEPVGRTVGYRTRDEKVVSAATRVEVITEGILVRRLQADPALAGTGLVVLDEVHERNLVTDLSLALLLDARRALRPDLRVLAMSATVDAGRLASVIGGGDGPAPVVTSDGRHHPVAVRWSPPEPRDRPEQHAARIVARAIGADDGDALVFLPGAAEIGRVSRALAGALPSGVDVRPLYGALAVPDQDRALAPSPEGRRRVVLATDIAESSLTVAGVRIVVDAGLARGPRFDPGTGLTRLATAPASRASADQRAGRAGRLGPGVAHRLWSEADHARRRPFAEPELAVVDLAGLVLELAVWGSAPADLPFLDQPPPAAWSEATGLLTGLGALDHHGRPTATGRAMVGLPLHPRLARMVIDGKRRGEGWSAAVLAAVLDERDVLAGRRQDRPADLANRLSLVEGAEAEASARGNRDALRSARRRAQEIARRAGIGTGPVDPTSAGPLVALAYPDRIAQARNPGRFRLRAGGGGWLPDTDPLAPAPFLAVADLDVGTGDGRIRTAAALDADDVAALVGDDVETVTTLVWDAERDDLRARTETRAGALVLSSSAGRAEPSDATVAALIHRVRATEGAVLRWTAAARTLRDRLGFLHRVDAEAWPDVSNGALLADLDVWLAPHLTGARGRADLERVDLARVLRSRLDHRQGRDLDRLAPARLELANGRSVAVTYDGDAPAISARVQDLYGTTRHPAVASGRIPVVVELLSPARRPVQVTADLPGFWAGSWRQVRKEMAGRYPKHDWPLDPAQATPSAPRTRRRP